MNKKIKFKLYVYDEENDNWWCQRIADTFDHALEWYEFLITYNKKCFIYDIETQVIISF